MYTNVDIISAMSEYQDYYSSINNLPLISFSCRQIDDLVFFKLLFKLYNLRMLDRCTFLDDIIFLRQRVLYRG